LDLMPRAVRLFKILGLFRFHEFQCTVLVILVFFLFFFIAGGGCVVDGFKAYAGLSYVCYFGEVGIITKLLVRRNLKLTCRIIIIFLHTRLILSSYFLGLLNVQDVLFFFFNDSISLGICAFGVVARRWLHIFVCFKIIGVLTVRRVCQNNMFF